MVYNYYCTDCGNEFCAEEIRFNLADFLGIGIEKYGWESNNNGGSWNLRRVALISIEKLWEISRKNGVDLRHNEKVFLRVTLSEFLQIMAENAGNEAGKGELLAHRVTSYPRSQLSEALPDILHTSAGSLVEREEILLRWKETLEWRFQLSSIAVEFIIKHENDDSMRELIERILDNTANYEAGFWLQPEFFEDGKNSAIYTVKYSHSVDGSYMEEIHDPLTIRGYCPKCGCPIIRGAGKYQHVLVGMLGENGVGKRSVQMALAEELVASFSAFQIRFPGTPLCESGYYLLQKNLRLFRNGWSVSKQDASSSIGSTVSFCISKADGSITKLITFVNVAGEQCYDLRHEQVGQRMFSMYPLITRCNIYLLFSPITQNDGVHSIHSNALLQIASRLYVNLADKTHIPPLCIVLTKTDLCSMSDKSMKGEYEEAIDTVPRYVETDENVYIRKGNPFEDLTPASDYEFASKLDDLRLIYEMSDRDNYRKPLYWCKKTYDEMAGRAYVSMMHCSALGRNSVRHSGKHDYFLSMEEGYDLRSFRDMYRVARGEMIQDEEDLFYKENGEERPFERIGIRDLWSWILKVIGLMPVGNTNQCIPFIPSYNEHYILSLDSDEQNYRAVSEDMIIRNKAVRALFINQSPMDNQVTREIMKKRGGFEPKLDKALVNLVKKNSVQKD